MDRRRLTRGLLVLLVEEDNNIVLRVEALMFDGPACNCQAQPRQNVATHFQHMSHSTEYPRRINLHIPHERTSPAGLRQRYSLIPAVTSISRTATRRTVGKCAFPKAGNIRVTEAVRRMRCREKTIGRYQALSWASSP